MKKYLRAGDEAPRYVKRASSSNLDPYADKLATWLAIALYAKLSICHHLMLA